MSTVDYILLALLAAWFVAAVLYLVRQKKKGGCVGCSGCASRDEMSKCACADGCARDHGCDRCCDSADNCADGRVRGNVYDSAYDHDRTCNRARDNGFDCFDGCARDYDCDRADNRVYSSAEVNDCVCSDDARQPCGGITARKNCVGCPHCNGGKLS